MTIIIIAIILVFVGKFVYDTFLTGNTNKDWEDYKKNHPHEARVIETNKGLNLRTKANIRTDGYYISRYDGPSSSGTDINLSIILIFNDKGFVYYEDMEGHPSFLNEDMKKLISSLVNENELNSNFGKYEIQKSGELHITLLDPSDMSNKDLSNPLSYTRLQGTVITNGLILDYKQKHYVESLQDFSEKTILSKLRFNFVKVTFS